MGSMRVDGRRVDVVAGDTIASAMHRAGMHTFSRSIKSHRRRGLYCGTGDCANCLVTVDGLPGERACVTPAHEGARVERETGWPSAERDLLAVTDRLHWVMPVGFYYKVFARPRWLWPLAERVIRRATGTGTLPRDVRRSAPTRFVRVDTLVIGGGVAGLAAATAAAADGGRVLLAEEGDIGARLADPAAREAAARGALAARAAGVEILEHHTATGVYEGPSVPLVGPEALVEVEAARVIVATGALEAHGVFPGNDLPGVWLGRGAARLAAIQRVAPGATAVVVANTHEGPSIAAALRDAGADVTLVAGRVLEARGRGRVSSATVLTPDGRRAFACDALVLSLGWQPRDTLLRMTADPEVSGAGDVVRPGSSLEEAEASGAAAGRGEPADPAEPRAAEPWPVLETAGYVCVCEDVRVHDLEAAWDEGWTSSEILKRYTTATMGPCQGALCSRHLAAFAAAKGAGETARGENDGAAAGSRSAPRRSDRRRARGDRTPDRAARQTRDGGCADGPLGFVGSPGHLRRRRRGDSRGPRAREPDGRLDPRQVPARRSRRSRAAGLGLPARRGRRCPGEGAVPARAR